MPGPEDVVVRLVPPQEGGQSVPATDAVQAIVSSCQDLVDVRLMARVPHDAVPGRVEDVVEGNGELGDAEASPEVSPDLRHHIDQPLAHFANEIGEL